MGCWGVGPFESDSACDWQGIHVVRPIEETVSAVLKAVKAAEKNPLPPPEMRRVSIPKLRRKGKGGVEKTSFLMPKTHEFGRSKITICGETWSGLNVDDHYFIALAAIQTALEMPEHVSFRSAREGISAEDVKKNRERIKASKGKLKAQRTRRIGGKIRVVVYSNQHLPVKARPRVPGFWEEAADLLERISKDDHWIDGFRDPSMMRLSLARSSADVEAKAATERFEDAKRAERWKRRAKKVPHVKRKSR